MSQMTAECTDGSAGSLSWGVPKQGESIRAIKNDSIDPGTVTDIDGNVYPTIKIGTQVWMKSSLRVTHYNNGVAIPEITGNAAWAALATDARCWFNNIPS